MICVLANVEARPEVYIHRAKPVDHVEDETARPQNRLFSENSPICRVLKSSETSELAVEL